MSEKYRRFLARNKAAPQFMFIIRVEDEMKKLIGTKQFYRRLLLLSVPIMIQNAITNFVGFLDNIMVGQLGTQQMSGVAIVNQFMFVFNLCVFGGLSGSGIFGAQFFGSGDHKGVRDTFRFKLITGIIIAGITFVLFVGFGDQLIRLYLTADHGADASDTFRYGNQYIHIILLELIPFIIVQIYASTLRETGQTFVPMLAGIIAVLVNLVFNYLFIFGKFGIPAMGVSGAAIATVLARLVECSIVVLWTHLNAGKNQFIQGAYRSLKIAPALAKEILIKGSPLLLNELLWSAGVAMVNQCFSVRGLEVVAAVNISSTISNLFNVVFIALGSSVSILVGQQLGAGQFEKAKDTAGKVIAFSTFCTVFTSILMVMMSGLFPSLFNTTAAVRLLATRMIQITAVLMPMQAFLHAVYFTIRSGGKTGITFLFDSGFSWCVAIPFTYCIVHFTSLAILPVYTLYYLLDVIKTTVGFFLFQKGIWIQNIVS